MLGRRSGSGVPGTSAVHLLQRLGVPERDGPRRPRTPRAGAGPPAYTKRPAGTSSRVRCVGVVDLDGLQAIEAREEEAGAVGAEGERRDAVAVERDRRDPIEVLGDLHGLVVVGDGGAVALVVHVGGEGGTGRGWVPQVKETSALGTSTGSFGDALATWSSTVKRRPVEAYTAAARPAMGVAEPFSRSTSTGPAARG